MVRYYKLFDLLNRKGMKKTDLLKIISSKTLAKISKGDNIQVDVIEKICLFLECQPADIMEVIKDEYYSNGVAIYKTDEIVYQDEKSIISMPHETFVVDDEIFVSKSMDFKEENL